MDDWKTGLTIGGLCVTGLVWLIRLEGRVNTTRELHDELRADVTYIRSRIDTAINGRDKH
jgi:hypothetical protein